MKRTIVAISAGLLVWSAAAMGPRPQKRTLNMLVLPTRYSVMQVGFDVARRFPSILVSYQAMPGNTPPVLHVWNGEAWMPLSFENFAEASFLRRIPDQAVLVGDESLLPASLADAATWCPRVINVPAVQTAPLLNALDRVYDFSQSDWSWFAGRYGLQLVDLNVGERKRDWYSDPFIGEYEGKLSERLQTERMREIRGTEIGARETPELERGEDVIGGDIDMPPQVVPEEGPTAGEASGREKSERPREEPPAAEEVELPATPPAAVRQAPAPPAMPDGPAPPPPPNPVEEAHESSTQDRPEHETVP